MGIGFEGSWIQAEPAAEEEDPRAVAGEAREAARVGLDGLHAGVEPLGQGIGDPVAEVAQQAAPMRFERGGHSLHGRYPAPHDAATPQLEELYCRLGVRLASGFTICFCNSHAFELFKLISSSSSKRWRPVSGTVPCSQR